MWIKQVELINFKNHKHSVIKFTKGLNIVGGPSNAGKSNIFSMIKWVYSDIVSTDYHMIGPSGDVCVGIITQIDELGNEYIIEKHSQYKGKKNVFILNGKEYYPTNNRIPAEIARLNPFVEIAVGKTKYIPQIMTQSARPFLIEGNSADNVSLCFWGTDVLLLEDIKKDLGKKIFTIEKDLGKLRSELQDINNEIDNYAHLSQWRNRINIIKVKEGQLNKLTEKLTNINHLYQDLNRHKAIIEELSVELQNVLNKDTEDMIMNYITDIEELENKISLFSEYNIEFQIVNQDIENCIKELDTIPNIDDINSLERKINEFQSISSKLQELTKLQNEYTEVCESIRQCEIDIAILDNIDDIQDKLDQYEKLDGQYNYLSQQQQELKRNSDFIVLLNNQLNITNKSYKELMDELSTIETCPMCNTHINNWEEHI